MPRLVRTSLVAVLAAALLMTLPALSSAVPAPQTPPRADLDRVGTQAREVLDDVIAAFSSGLAARAARPSTDEHGRDVTLLLRDLRAALPALTGDDKRTAQAFLARPRDPGGDGVLCSGCQPIVLNGTVETSASEHFLVHYQTNPPFLGRNQVATEQQVATTKEVLEEVWDEEIGRLGFRQPLSDQGEPSFGSSSNPDGRIDVFLADIGDDGIYGYVSSDSNGAQVAPYIVLDNDFTEFALGPQHSLKVTVAHEFFHAIQFAYDASETPWFTEGTAVWIEDIVYPTINDYLQYLTVSQIVRPLQSTNFTGGLERYGAVTFWKYLTEGFNSNSIIKSIWTAADFPRNKNGITAAKDVLKARGHSWIPAYSRYAVWNTLPAGTYADRGRFPKPGAWSRATLSRTATSTGSRKVAINHLASAPLFVYPGSTLPSQAKLRISVNAPNTALGTAARVQLRMRSGKVKFYSVPLTSTGAGGLTVSFNRTQVAAAIVTLTNASTSINNQVFVVSARIVY